MSKEYVRLTDEEMVERAKMYAGGVGSIIHFDKDAEVNRDPDGAWVQAWVWIDYPRKEEP